MIRARSTNGRWLISLLITSLISASCSFSPSQIQQNLWTQNTRTLGTELWDSNRDQGDYHGIDGVKTGSNEILDLAKPLRRVLTVQNFLGGEMRKGERVAGGLDGNGNSFASAPAPLPTLSPNNLPETFFTGPAGPHEPMNNIRSWSLGAGMGGGGEGERQADNEQQLATIEVEESDAWETSLKMKQRPYLSRAITRMIAKEREKRPGKIAKVFKELETAEDPLWFQVCFEAKEALKKEEGGEKGMREEERRWSEAMTLCTESQRTTFINLPLP